MPLKTAPFGPGESLKYVRSKKTTPAHNTGLLLRLGFIVCLALGACAKHPELSVPSPDVVQERVEGQDVDVFAEILDSLSVDTRPDDLWGKDSVLRVERYDFADDARSYAVLALTAQQGPRADVNWQCLVFSQDNAEWEFLGYVDVTGQKYHSPINPRVVRLGHDTYLLVEQLTGWGTGIQNYADFWYLMTGGSAVVALHYPVRGYVMDSARWLWAEHDAQLISYDSRGSSHAVKIRGETNYSYWDVDAQAGGPLFSVEETRDYLWDSSGQRFVESGTRDAVIGNAGFVQKYYEQLRRLAEEGSDQERAWLAGFLGEVSVSPEKDILLGLLSD